MSYYLGIKVQQQSERVHILKEVCKRDSVEIQQSILLRHSYYDEFKTFKKRWWRTCRSNQVQEFCQSLGYLTTTKLDIAYGVGLVSRYIEKSGESQWWTIIIILLHTKGQDYVSFVCIRWGWKLKSLLPQWLGWLLRWKEKQGHGIFSYYKGVFL